LSELDDGQTFAHGSHGRLQNIFGVLGVAAVDRHAATLDASCTRRTSPRRPTSPVGSSRSSRRTVPFGSGQRLLQSDLTSIVPPAPSSCMLSSDLCLRQDVPRPSPRTYALGGALHRCRSCSSLRPERSIHSWTSRVTRRTRQTTSTRTPWPRARPCRAAGTRDRPATQQPQRTRLAGHGQLLQCHRQGA